MAAGSGEVPVVPTEAAEGKEEGEVSAAAVEKKGEGAVVSEAEKKGESDMVSEVVEKLMSEATEKVVSEALEKVVWDAAKKVVSEESVEKAPAAEAGKREEEEESGRIITLESNEGEQADVTEASARLSELLGEMIDAGSADNVIPLLEVDSDTLRKVIEYCDNHANFAANNKSGTEEEKDWDEGFISELDKDKGALFAVIMASNYLNIRGLLDLTCQKVADTIKGKTPEEIREIFNIKNDLTEQEKEEIRKENDKAFE